GCTILVHAEQGLGDSIQFCRYIPLLRQRGAKVIFECARELHRLFDRDTPLIAPGQDRPPFDLHCPLMSLPLAFGTTLETIPARIPYLHADPQLVEQWRQRLGPSDGPLRVGLNWAGNPNQGDDRRRSLHLSQLAPLAKAKNVIFYSLQKGY